MKVSLTCSLDCSYTALARRPPVRGTAVGRVLKSDPAERASSHAGKHRVTARAIALLNSGPATVVIRSFRSYYALLALARLRGRRQARHRSDRRRRRGRGEVGARPRRGDAGRARRRLPRGRAQRGLGARCARQPRSCHRSGVPSTPRSRTTSTLCSPFTSSARRRPSSRPLAREFAAVRRDARPPVARRADGDRRQRAQPQPLLAAAVRGRTVATRPRPRTRRCSPRPTTR